MMQMALIQTQLTKVPHVTSCLPPDDLREPPIVVQSSMFHDEDAVSLLYAQYPCRELQIRALITLLEVEIHIISLATEVDCEQRKFPSPPKLVVHGLEATGKSSIVKSALEKLGVSYAIVDSRECITGRQLLERTVSQCLDALKDNGDDFRQLPRCDSLSALHVCLETILRSQEKLILVFDGIDKQRDAPYTLLPALARLGEYVCTLSLIPSCLTIV